MEFEYGHKINLFFSFICFTFVMNCKYKTINLKKMKIYQLKTARDFYNSIKKNHSLEEVMQMYAEDVAKKFAAECVNEALGNKMEVSNSLHYAIENKYKSIIWDECN